MNNTKNKTSTPIIGKKILFINSIRKDMASGGNTATRTIINHLKEKNTIKEVGISPNKEIISDITFGILTLPAFIFSFISRKNKIIWLEFLSRLSPSILIRIIYFKLKIKPDFIIFNHHSSFIFSIFLKKKDCIFIWHDLPSTKKHENKKHASALISAWIERKLIANANSHFTLSFTEQKYLSRLHHIDALIFPVINTTSRTRSKLGKENNWLLIGNWNRSENRTGAEDFLKKCNVLNHQFPIKQHTFHIAGHGSESFIENFKKITPEISKLNIKTTDHYQDISDFEEISLIAPILSGAGIKLKTIESWSAGIPVIGTKQAFSGLTAKIWKPGGLCFETVEEIAKFCYSTNSSELIRKNLNPTKSYTLYQEAISKSIIN